MCCHEQQIQKLSSCTSQRKLNYQKPQKNTVCGGVWKGFAIGGKVRAAQSETKYALSGHFEVCLIQLYAYNYYTKARSRGLQLSYPYRLFHLQHAAAPLTLRGPKNTKDFPILSSHHIWKAPNNTSGMQARAGVLKESTDPSKMFNCPFGGKFIIGQNE